MKILVINAGSSSLKYQLIDMDGEQVLAKGNCERIGIDGKITHKTGTGVVIAKEVAMPDHAAAFAEVKRALTEGEGKVINDLSEVSAIGHRVVQGGSQFNTSVLIDEKVMKAIEDNAILAPLHNPANMMGIEAATATFGKDIPQVAVFDTSFHQTMPDKAFMYGVPYEYYEKYGVRKYGYHGTSHRFVSKRCFELLGKPDGKGTRIITCHLGNGSSLAAIQDGKVLDTTMGMTPLDGFLMGTRCGSIDPSVVTFLMEKEGLSIKEADAMMNKKSGMLGISGLSSDDRDVSAAKAAGNPRAKLAWDMRTYQITKLVGGFVAALGGVDAIVFTAGIGENSPDIRREILESMAYLGVKVDADANNCRGKEVEITTPASTVRGFVIPTDEELLIARDTKALVEG